MYSHVNGAKGICSFETQKNIFLNIFGYLYIRMVCKLTSGKLTF